MSPLSSSQSPDRVMRHSMTAPLPPIAPRPMPLIERRTAPALPARMRIVASRAQLDALAVVADAARDAGDRHAVLARARGTSPHRPGASVAVRPSPGPTVTRRVSGSAEVGVTTTSQMPASSDRLPLNAPAASAVMLDGCGCRRRGGGDLDRGTGGVGDREGRRGRRDRARRSASIASPGVAVPDTATAPVTLASAAGWSSAHRHAADRRARLHLAHHVDAHHGHR